MPDGTLFLTEDEMLAIEDSLIDYDDPMDDIDRETLMNCRTVGSPAPQGLFNDHTVITDEVPF